MQDRSTPAKTSPSDCKGPMECSKSAEIKWSGARISARPKGGRSTESKAIHPEPKDSLERGEREGGGEEEQKHPPLAP